MNNLNRPIYSMHCDDEDIWPGKICVVIEFACCKSSCTPCSFNKKSVTFGFDAETALQYANGVVVDGHSVDAVVLTGCDPLYSPEETGRLINRLYSCRLNVMLDTWLDGVDMMSLDAASKIARLRIRIPAGFHGEDSNPMFNMNINELIEGRTRGRQSGYTWVCPTMSLELATLVCSDTTVDQLTKTAGWLGDIGLSTSPWYLYVSKDSELSQAELMDLVMCTGAKLRRYKNV